MQYSKKCSVMLAAGMGAAVCLSGTPALAVSGLDGNDIPFNMKHSEFSGKISLFNSTGTWLAKAGGNNTGFARTGVYLQTYNTGVNCEVGSFATSVKLNSVGPDRYIKIRFNDGTQYYGWSQFQVSGSTFLFGAWSYAPVGSGIKTLSSSVSASKLGLSDGRTKLLWSNTNEDGIARYETQTKDASGAWTTVSSDAAGAGSYSATVPAGVACRIVVEKVDGATEEIGF